MSVLKVLSGSPNVNSMQSLYMKFCINLRSIKSNYHDYYFVYDLMKVEPSQTAVIFFMSHGNVSCISNIKKI